MKTIHIVFNAHIDPIWLWPWTSGLDEAIATCRSACERLDRHPDLFFSQGEAWLFSQVERADPGLFARIVAHVHSGRWEIVNGWWTQPDCNLPSGVGFERQIGIGKAYFNDRLGTFPRVGYNIDSFGHAATLPGFMHVAGQDRYVMMRPQEHEMKLPARYFRWRGYEGGPEVTTFRIASAYNGGQDLNLIKASLNELPAGFEHTMAYLGVGDHGGGPTEELIAWCRENVDAIPGAKLVFSTPGRFFDAIQPRLAELPLVTGELQHHAIGCFTVHRAVKVGIKRAEHLLRMAEVTVGDRPDARIAQQLDEAWRKVCSHHFHDTMGGTCIPSAYRAVDDQLGYAAAVADDLMQFGLRTRMRGLPDDPAPRVVVYNLSDAAFDGWIECEPWVEGIWTSGYRLLDEVGAEVPFQGLQTEALLAHFGQSRLLIRLAIPADGWRVLRLSRDVPPASIVPRVRTPGDILANDTGVCVDLGRERLTGPLGDLALPRLEMVEDLSDTWSHRLDRYVSGPVISPVWSAPTILDDGPLMASAIRIGTIGESRLRAEWRVYADEAVAELRLSVHWLEKHQVLKLTLPLPSAALGRVDGIPGGSIARVVDGRELPMRDWTLVDLGDGKRLGVVTPDTFALDGDRRRVRLTLLRSPLMAHHEPHLGSAGRVTVSDQGVHEFRFRFHVGREANARRLDAEGLGWGRAPITADLTRGMKARGF